MDKQKEIERYLSCVLCNQKFSKINKPLIMFCGHNICEDCRLKNNKKVSCTTCGKVFSKREIKKFPINYSILENKLLSLSEKETSKKNSPTISNKDENNKDNEKSLECLNNLSPQVCMNFMSTLINQVSKIIETNPTKDNQINKDNNNTNTNVNEEKKNIFEEIINKRDLIIKDTFNLIDSLEKNFINYSNIFFDSMIDLFKNNPEIFTNDLTICQLLEESGIINYGDNIKLEKFLDMIKDIDGEKLKSCTKFDDIYELVKDKNKEITYENFISLFFFFNKIYELKIKKIPKIFEEQNKIYRNKKENHSNFIHLLTNLAQKFEMKLSDIFYDITIYKSCHFIYDINKNEKIKQSINNFYIKNEKLFEEYNNIIFIYEPIENSIKVEIIKIKELKDELIIDSYLILNKILFILSEKKFYMYEITTEKYSSFNTIANQEIEKNTKIFKYDTSIMKISSNYFESINLRDDMSKNEWRTMSLFENTPGKIKRPYPVCHSSDYIYVLDVEDKKINNIYLYNEESDFWEKREIKLEIKPKDDDKQKENNNKDSLDQNNNNNKDNEKEEIIIVKQLYLEDYFFFNKCFACIFGGRHPVTKKFNKDVYMIDPNKGIIKQIINFDDYISDDMVILDLNCGILNKNVDFIFIYHLINDNNVKIIIIRKKIIENDISLDSKLEVVLNGNISDIYQ